MPANLALRVLSRHKVDPQPAALEFVNGLIGDGNLTGVRNLARARYDGAEQWTQIGNEIYRSRMWACWAEDSNGGPSEVGGDCEGVSKAVAGERERPVAVKWASIWRALIGSTESCSEGNRDRDGYLLQRCGKKGVLKRVDCAVNLEENRAAPRQEGVLQTWVGGE